jgi:hypothetical protein
MKKNLLKLRYCPPQQGFFTVSVIIIVFSIMFSIQTPAQTDTIKVSSDVPPGEGNLNIAIHDAITAGTLSNTVFELEPNGYYILTETITIPAGEHLTIVASEPGKTQLTAPPQILWTSNSSINTDINFLCEGELTLKNIWVRYADINGEQIGSQILIVDNTNPNIQERATFEGVIFDYAPVPPQYYGGAVTVTADHFVGTFKNCYFKNCIDPHFRYYGRAVSFPFQSEGWHIDSLLFENCTFANVGYVYSQEANNYADYVWFNHCTFFNTAMFTLELGKWYWLSVANSIFINAFMLGDIPAYRDGEPYGATVSIESISNFGFPVPFTENNRHILFTTSNYYIEEWLSDWMQNNPYSQMLNMQRRYDEVPVPQPMMNSTTTDFFTSGNFPYMNAFNLYDGADPDFILPSTNIDSLKAWLLCKWDSNCQFNWAYKPEDGLYQKWPLTEDLSYTNEELKSAGMGGFPLGDLYHWWPEQYQQWKAQEEYENQNILNLLNNGVDAPGVTLLISPENHSENQEVDSIIFIWNSASLASGYEFQLSSSPLFTTLVARDSISDTTFTVTSLQYQTVYYWRVRAYNDDGFSLFSPAGLFTTIGEILTTPVLHSPPGNAFDLLPVIELICSKTPDAAQYHWQVTRNISSNNFIVNDSTSDSTITVGPLLPGKKYYWKVRGVSSTGSSDFTSVDSFTVMSVPSSPELISPVSTTNEELLTTFVWRHSELATEYHLQVSRDSRISMMIDADTLVTDTTVTLSDSLESNTLYYWRVRGKNEAGEGLFSQVAEFNTKISVDVKDDDKLPEAFALFQNYPNPFNPVTQIKYSIPEYSYVTLTIYNLLGEAVIVLYEGVRQVGNYSVLFDGSGLVSGVYLYQLKAENFVETKKFLLIK